MSSCRGNRMEPLATCFLVEIRLHDHSEKHGPALPRLETTQRTTRVLRDRNDLELLTGCSDYIPNGFAHQRPCHWGYKGNGAGLRVSFVLSHDTIFLHAPIVALEGHRAPKGDRVS